MEFPPLLQYCIFQVCTAPCVGGQANFFLFVRKFANSWADSAIGNPQIPQVCESANRKSANFCMINPQNANMQIS